MTADYGQAIRVMHHGCEDLADYIGFDHPEALSMMAMGILLGYAFSLQVMTRRPAIEHVERALRLAAERHGQAKEMDGEDGGAALVALKTIIDEFGVPHERWEEKRARA